MANYMIEATLHRDKDVTIRANSREEALEKFRYRHPGYKVEAVNDALVLGYCEVSGRPIFDGDDYQQDSEGVMWLTNAE